MVCICRSAAGPAQGSRQVKQANISACSSYSLHPYLGIASSSLFSSAWIIGPWLSRCTSTIFSPHRRVVIIKGTAPRALHKVALKNTSNLFLTLVTIPGPIPRHSQDLEGCTFLSTQASNAKVCSQTPLTVLRCPNQRPGSLGPGLLQL